MEIKSIIHKNIKYMLSLLVCICLVGTFIVNLSAQNKDANLSLIVEQKFDIKNKEISNIDNLFHYRLTASNKETPMPLGAQDNQYLFSIQGNGSFEIGPMTFLQEGVYKYQLTHISLESQYYRHDYSIYDITVYVTQNEGVHSVVENVNTGEKVSKIEYAHSYYESQSEDNGDVLGDIFNPSPGKQVTTGDQTLIHLYLGMSVMSFILILILCVIYIRKKDYQE